LSAGRPAALAEAVYAVGVADQLTSGVLVMGLVRFGLVLAVLLAAAGSADAQAVRSPQTPQDFIAILKPAPTAAGPTTGVRTRSLAPTTGAAAPAAGSSGSGRVPDLQILFEFNSAELTQQARDRLDVLGAALASNDLRPFNFQIAGHTDAVGAPQYNLDLSRRRAEAVVDYLVTRWGIDIERLRARGFGMSRLLVPSEGANAKNRRVEVETLVPN
jgi:outer membrane protein OmpA-like peptidoglycan-associated protein